LRATISASIINQPRHRIAILIVAATSSRLSRHTEARRIHLQWRTRVVEDCARQRCPARCPDALPLVDTHIKQVTHERRTSTRPQQRQHVAVSNSSDASLA
jgi:hypothetical protein